MANLVLKTAGLKDVRKPIPNALLPYFARWQSNNSSRDLGIERFVFDLYSINEQLPGNRQPLYRDFKPEYGVAPWARSALYQYLLWEPKMTKEDRCFVFATFREGSKTSWFVQFLLQYELLVGQYGIYFNDHIFPEQDFQLIQCKNADEAKKRLMTISAFLNKQTIREIFGELKPSFKEVKEKEGKDTGGLLILSNGYIFQASGIDQPARGLNVLGARPKKITFDDPQNKENTKTADRREQCDKQVMEESLPAAVDWGSIVYIGNKVHPDDTLGKLLDPENKQWKKQFHTVSVKIIDGKVYPGDGDLDNEVPHWGKRHTIEQIKKRRAFYEGQPKLGGLKGFLKEYYNIIKSDADYKIKYYKAEFFRQFGINWMKIYKEIGFDIVNVNVYIGCDPAISEKKNSSDSTISVIAVDSNKRRYILELRGGKFDIHDRYWDDGKAPETIAVEPNEVSNIRRRGSVEEIIRAYLKYKANGIAVEVNATNSTYLNELLDKMRKMGLNVPIMPYRSTRDKTDANREEVMCFFESGHYYLAGEESEGGMIGRNDMVKLKAEIQAFPFTRQDYIDSLRIAQPLFSYPVRITYNPLGVQLVQAEKKYEQPYEKSNQNGLLTNDRESWIIY